jgi:hypothetical protein
MKSGEYKEAKQVVTDMEQIRVSIANPGYLMSLDVCYESDPKRSEENHWGMKADFYSSMMPENDEIMRYEREPGSY